MLKSVERLEGDVDAHRDEEVSGLSPVPKFNVPVPRPMSQEYGGLEKRTARWGGQPRQLSLLAQFGHCPLQRRCRAVHAISVVGILRLEDDGPVVTRLLSCIAVQCFHQG